MDQKHAPLTLTILYLNGLVDTGRFDGISVDEVAAHIKDGSIIKFLKERLGEDARALAGILEGKTYGEFGRFWTQSLKSMQDAYGQASRKWGVSDRGLCLLIAWTNEIVQAGTGWQPRPMAGVDPYPTGIELEPGDVGKVDA